MNYSIKRQAKQMKAITASVVLTIAILVSPSEVFAAICLLGLAVIGFCAFCVALGDYDIG